MSTFLLAVTALEAGQPTDQLTEGGAWWGAAVWILVSLAFLVGAIWLAATAIRRPNRR